RGRFSRFARLLGFAHSRIVPDEPTEASLLPTVVANPSGAVPPEAPGTVTRRHDSNGLRFVCEHGPIGSGAPAAVEWSGSRNRLGRVASRHAQRRCRPRSPPHHCPRAGASSVPRLPHRESSGPAENGISGEWSEGGFRLHLLARPPYGIGRGPIERLTLDALLGEPAARGRLHALVRRGQRLGRATAIAPTGGPACAAVPPFGSVRRDLHQPIEGPTRLVHLTVVEERAAVLEERGHVARLEMHRR